MTQNNPIPAIRAELPGDADAVCSLLEAAFETTGEAVLVGAMRGVVEPAVSQVALRDGVVVGHALWTPVRVGDLGDSADAAFETAPLAMALGPMAVLPDHQRTGVGAALIESGVAACRALGAHALFVLGHADYYPRFGFEPALRHGCIFQSERFAAHFFVRLLEPGPLPFSGEVHYHAAFDGV